MQNLTTVRTLGFRRLQVCKIGADELVSKQRLVAVDSVDGQDLRIQLIFCFI